MLFVRKLCVFEGFRRLRRFAVCGVIFLDWSIGVVRCGVLHNYYGVELNEFARKELN